MSTVDAADDVSVDLDIGDGRTLITVDGERTVAIVVESEAGEQIYLPPEDFAGQPDGPGRTPYDSPYDASTSDDTPYEGTIGSKSPYEGGQVPSQTVGVQSTSDGFRVLHPEPVTDVRLLR